MRFFLKILKVDKPVCFADLGAKSGGLHWPGSRASKKMRERFTGPSAMSLPAPGWRWRPTQGGVLKRIEREAAGRPEHPVSCGRGAGRRVLPLLSLVLVAVALVVSACSATRPAGQARDMARDLAASAGMSPLTLDESGFRLAAFLKNGPGKDLVVYIEGDGHAWANRRTPSADPTPRELLVLRLAALDPAPKALYLARPCQFSQAAPAACTPDLWTNARYSQTVVSSLNRALDEAKALSGADRLHLVGYSGGGALAVLVAANRKDVSDILTVAANLDTAAWTAHHGISPLAGSLNPADKASQVAAIPQTHLCGNQDKVVPAFLCQRYLARMGLPETARCLEIGGVNHTQGLESRWVDLLAAHRRFVEERKR